MGGGRYELSRNMLGGKGDVLASSTKKENGLDQEIKGKERGTEESENRSLQFSKPGEEKLKRAKKGRKSVKTRFTSTVSPSSAELALLSRGGTGDPRQGDRRSITEVGESDSLLTFHTMPRQKRRKRKHLANKKKNNEPLIG